MLEKNVHSAAVWLNVMYMSVTFYGLYCCSNYFFSSLIFCLDVLAITESRILKSLTIIVYYYFSLQFCRCLLHIFECYYVVCIFIYNYYGYAGVSQSVRAVVTKYCRPGGL